MPNRSAVIFITAHGASSARGTVVPVRNHNVIFLTTAGSSFELTSHNLVLRLLMDNAGEDSLQERLKMIENLPSTVSVSKTHLPTEALCPPIFNLASAHDRTTLASYIMEATRLATNSQKAWELLEHTLRPASDVLGRRDALTPWNYPAEFINFVGPVTLLSNNLLKGI